MTFSADLAAKRYLRSFQPKRINHRFTDALILGSGLAGMRAALELGDRHSVLVITKEGAAQSNSSWAQGGIAAVWDPADRFESHFQDTLIAGAGLCDTRTVDVVVREAPDRVRELIEWGAKFDTVDGRIDLTLEGGHSAHRILHALGDATGRELMRAVLAEVARRPGIEVVENRFTLDLLVHEGRCEGALIADRDGALTAVWSRAVILATGGCGQIFRETTNPAVATGDGLALAWRAGASVQDLEFIQFHPTVLYVAGLARHLITEAVRGEGARLVDSLGHRFMPDYDPRGELAPRDVVARSIVRQMARTQHPCVYLDQSHLDAKRTRERFPGLNELCHRFGIDFARDRIPVRPGAHYMIGGVTTDHDGRTDLPGLWAAGEVAATGLHGANRLASNSLIEAVVFGRRCGASAAEAMDGAAGGLKLHPVPTRANPAPPEELDLRDIRNSLAAMMFREAGIERSADGLSRALEQVRFWSQYVLGREFPSREGWELQNLLTLSALIVESALARMESRGVHLRRDHPETDDARWLVHLRRGINRSGLERVPVERDLLPALSETTAAPGVE
jgi:L-aspartate oxidase